MIARCVYVDNIVLIISVLAVAALGFIPVILLSRHFSQNRRTIIERPRGEEKRRNKITDAGADPLSEFERTGQVFFEEKDGT